MTKGKPRTEPAGNWNRATAPISETTSAARIVLQAPRKPRSADERRVLPPRTTFNDNGSSKTSSIFVEDASYFRLKNVELGYDMGAARRLYVSGQNLWTMTNYTGLDPESTDILDRGTYPQAKAFLFGLNATF